MLCRDGVAWRLPNKAHFPGLSMVDNRADETTGAAPSVDAAIRSAIVWNFATIAFAQIVLAAIFLMLAARLEPATFGIFALASVMTDAFYVLGLSAAVDSIVQRQDFSRKTLSTVTWVSGALCVVFALVFFGVAAMYANAIGSGEVAVVLEALSLTTLMLPFAVAPTAIMRQRLDMKGLALLNMAAAITGGLAGLATSFTEAITWSLVVQRIVTTAAFIILATLRTRMTPTLALDLQAARQWLAGASRIFTGQGITALTPRIADVLIGVFFGPVIVGFVRVATRLSDLLIGLLVSPITQLWVTLLSRNADSAAAQRSIFLRLSGLTALIALPGFVGLGLVANEVVALILPPNYAPVAGPLAVLCMLGIFTPLTSQRNAVFTALRRYNHLVWFSVVDFAASIVGMLATAQFGPLAMLSTGAFTGTILVVFALPIILRSLDLDAGTLVARLAPPYTSVAVMAAVVLAEHFILTGLSPLAFLVTKAATGAAVYGGMMLVFFRPALTDAMTVLSRR